ncbi:hypothetical protein [Agrobacterium salinitolerans]|uniref:Uncharacterized protein n=1 Tax=Agrobacterium salinitolerans TaxID=1183413 RepID=A0A9X3KRD8_9HYPH|nr:hypothetical protein [Agrobacterium salinitolerans]MCZ7938476.1 hypothetical protein [Agrobacterium salinitolerans]
MSQTFIATYRRGYEAGLAAATASCDPVAYLRHGEQTFVQNVPFGAMWISDKDDPRAFPVYDRPQEPAPSVAVKAEQPEGTVGEMTPGRAIYFLERFKREEKMLGPHEQWALDFSIAALSAQVQDAGCEICNGTGKEARHQICRDCDETEPSVTVKALELNGVPDALAYGKGVWRTCTGCHESNEGYPTGPFSDTLKCHLGGGCFECGSIGAVWDTTDYEDMGNYIALSAQVQDVAERQPRVEAGSKLLDISQRLIKWDTDFPVNC